MQPSLRIGSFQLYPTAIKIEGRPAVDEWLAPLTFAIWVQRASPWWIGDLLNAGDARFGEAFSQACEGIVSADMLQRYEAVARKVPAENRRPNLSWSAHAAVARLPREKQREMLALAEKHGWSSTDLRVRVRASLRGETWNPETTEATENNDEAD